MRPVELGIYLPQVGFTYAEILERAQSCEDTHDRAAPATLRLLAERVLPAFVAA